MANSNEKKWAEARRKKNRGEIRIIGPNTFEDLLSGIVFVGDPDAYYRGEDGHWIAQGGRRKDNPDGSYTVGPWTVTPAKPDFITRFPEGTSNRDIARYRAFKRGVPFEPHKKQETTGAWNEYYGSLNPRETFIP